MLEFLMGTDAHAKREYIGRRLYETVTAGEKCVLIVPEQENFERDKELMLRYGEKISNGMQITSFSHFCRAFLEERGQAVKPAADDTAVSVLMSLAVKQAADELEIYRAHNRRPGRVAELVSFYNKLVNAGKTPADLSEAGRRSGGSLGNKTRELSLIFTVFEGLLSSRFSTETDNINVSAKLLWETDVFKDTDFWFDDFRGFTGAQIKWIAALMPRCRNMYVSIAGAAVPGGGPVFPHAMENRGRLYNAAKKAGVDVRERLIELLPKSEGLGFLRENLFVPAPGKFIGVPEDIRVLCAADRYEECELIALESKRLLDEGVCRAREIAVLHRDEGLNAPLIAAFRKYGVPVFEDERRPLFSYPLTRFMLAAVEIAAKGFSTETVLAAYKTNLTGVSVENAARLQNYVYRWQIDGRRWERDFTLNPRGYGEKEDDDSAAELAVVNEARRALVEPLLRLKTAMAANDAERSCRAVYYFLKETQAAEHFKEYAEYLFARGEEARAVECAGVWDVCMESLDALCGALGKNSVTPQFFYELLSLILSGGSVGYIPPGVDKVTVGSVDRTRILAPKAVFLPGFVEGVYPKNTVIAGILSAKELRRLAREDLSLESLPEDLYEEERLILYNALNLAEERLYISYPAALTTGEKTAPSPVLDEMLEMMKDLKAVSSAEISPMERIRSAESAFSQFAALPDRTGPLACTLEAFLKEGSVYAARLLSLARATGGVETQFQNPAEAVRLFGRDISMSASKAETYSKCPFKYFCRYGMGVEKITASRLDARINGLLIHQAMQDIFNAHLGRGLADVSDEDLLAEVDRSVDAYCEEFLGGKENLPPAMQRTVGRLKREIFDILCVRRDEFNTCLFHTVANELSIGYNGEIGGYEVPLPDGGRLVINGSVDRVDLMRDGDVSYVRVIDYKTGGKDFRLSDIFFGLNMQMLIYLFAICDNGKALFGDLLPAGVLYVPAKNTGESLERAATQEEIARRRTENGRMNGIILENADVLRGMETAARGIFLNAYIDDGGTLRGNFLTLRQFSLLHKKIDEMLRDTGMAIHAGIVPALPVDEGGHDACTFCDYASVCLIDAGAPKRMVSKEKHTDAVKRLCEEAGEE